MDLQSVKQFQLSPSGKEQCDDPHKMSPWAVRQANSHVVYTDIYGFYNASWFIHLFSPKIDKLKLR